MLAKRSVVIAAAIGIAAGLLPGTPSARATQVDTAAVLEHYADMAHAVYSDSLAAAKLLQKAVSDMLAKPSPETLAAARTVWIEARVPYLQSEALRFTNPIVDEWELLASKVSLACLVAAGSLSILDGLLILRRRCNLHRG